MDISIFLAKVIGLYLLITSVIVLKKPRLQEVIDELSRNKGMKVVWGLFTLILGILMVVSHNIWTDGFRIVITLIAWIVLLKGALIIWLKDSTYKEWVNKFNNESFLTAVGVGYLILGVYLTYVGFFI